MLRSHSYRQGWSSFSHVSIYHNGHNWSIVLSSWRRLPVYYYRLAEYAGRGPAIARILSFQSCVDGRHLYDSGHRPEDGALSIACMGSKCLCRCAINGQRSYCALNDQGGGIHDDTGYVYCF